MKVNQDLKGILQSVCHITDDMGKCSAPGDHRYVVSTNIYNRLNDICNVADNKELSTNKVVGIFTSLELMPYKLSNCDRKGKSYRGNGNAYLALDNIRHEIRMYGSKYQGVFDRFSYTPKKMR